MHDWRWRWRRWYPYYRSWLRWSPYRSSRRWSSPYYRYWRRWSPYYRYAYSNYDRRKFDRVYSELQHKMHMFKSFLASLPKNRSEMVNHLEIPDDILKPHVYTDFESDLLIRSDSLQSGSLDECDLKVKGGLDTDSSISLSRAMTDSEIDYDRFRRLKNRSVDPFDELKMAVKAFPPEYLESLQSYEIEVPEVASSPIKRLLHNEELERRMERYFEEECRVFTPDDPGLLDLEDALQSIDLKALEADLDSI